MSDFIIGHNCMTGSSGGWHIILSVEFYLSLNWWENKRLKEIIKERS
jgi:hypothetical protein